MPAGPGTLLSVEPIADRLSCDGAARPSASLTAPASSSGRKHPRPTEKQGKRGNALMWNQVYDPLGSATLSTIAAALPVVTLLALIASNKVKAHIAAIIALIVANLVAIYFFTMPANLSLRSTVLGAVTGFFPI